LRCGPLLIESLVGAPGALRAERDRPDALVFGLVGTGRASAHRLAERDGLAAERAVDAGVEDVNREAEARHREPVVVRADRKEGMPRMAGPRRRPRDGVAAVPAAGDHVVVVFGLGLAAVDRAREVTGPEVFEPAARRP